MREQASFIALTDCSFISRIYVRTASLKSLSCLSCTIFLSSCNSVDRVFKKSRSSLLISAQALTKLNLCVLWEVLAHSLQILCLSSMQKNSNSKS